MRVIHAPQVISGNAIGLAKAERSIGLDSTTLALEGHPFGYTADITLATTRLQRELQRRRALRYLIENADVVHFNGGLSISPHVIAHDIGSRATRIVNRAYNVYAAPQELRDVPILLEHGIGVVVTFQGDDARQGSYLNRPAFTEAVDTYSPHGDAVKQKRIQKWDAMASSIFALNPDLLEVLPNRALFVPYASVAPEAFAFSAQNPDQDRPLRILHAPSDTRIKGTEFIVSAIEALKASGESIELDLVTGLTNVELLQRMRHADLVVDQVLVGWFGSFAVEAMAMGIPVLAYMHPEDLARIPQQMADDIPIMNTDHLSVTQALRDAILRMRTDARSWQVASRTFVERWYNPHDIATSMVPHYEAAIEAARDWKVAKT